MNLNLVGSQNSGVQVICRCVISLVRPDGHTSVQAYNLYNMTGGSGGNVSFQNPIGLHTGMAIQVCKGYVDLSYHLHFRISSVMPISFWVQAKDSDLFELQVVALAMAEGEGGLATRPVAGSCEFAHMLSYQIPICLHTCTCIRAYK